MRTSLLALLMAILSLTVSAEELPRSSRPAMKGMELYSWRNCAACEWQFAVLPGTNRLKTLDEIRRPPKTLTGIEQLEQRLALLAEGESVFWFHRSLAELTYPEPEVIREIVSFAAQRKISVVVQR